MKIKIVTLSILLAVLSACASITPIKNKNLRLINGASLLIENGKATKIITSTGATVSVKKGMMELDNGDFIYIGQDGRVKIMKTNNSSQL